LKSLNDDGHEGSGQKHPHRVFGCERKVLMSLVVVSFHVSEMMENSSHNEFIEQDNQEEQTV